MLPNLNRVFSVPATIASCCLFVAGCATESNRTVEVQKPTSAASANSYSGLKSSIAVGKFDNRSSYLRGIFSDTQRLIRSRSER